MIPGSACILVQCIDLVCTAVKHGCTAVQRVYRAVAWRSVGTIVTAALALALFIPMVHSMVELAYVDPANGPLEMMVYVQTTPDVTAAMAKVNYADQKLHGGKHQLQIWVGQGEEWPMYWYLRDYYMDPHPGTYVTFDPNVSDKFAEGVAVPMCYSCCRPMPRRSWRRILAIMTPV